MLLTICQYHVSLLLHNLDLIYTWANVLVVWLYPIQFCVKLTMAECFLDLCTCMQRHLCILEEVLLPTPTPSMVVNLNSPSPFMVFPKSPDLDLLIIVLLFVIPKL
jgi:hypothetical protein